MAFSLAPGAYQDVRVQIAVPEAGEPTLKAHAELLATIQDRIIPQLVLSHCAKSPEAPNAQVRSAQTTKRLIVRPDAVQVLRLADIAAAQDGGHALAYVETIMRGGVALESILLDLIAPAATSLGDQWEDDMKSFAEVTLGLIALQHVLHVLGSAVPATLAPESVGQRGFVVLVCPLTQPQEAGLGFLQHTLGMHLRAVFLRRAGWGAEVAPTLSKSDLTSLVRSEHVEAVEISVNQDDSLDELGVLVGSVNKASMNRDIVVMVAGSAATSRPSPRDGYVHCASPDDAVRWLDQRAKHASP